MTQIIAALLLMTFATFANAGSAMKYEGSCSGSLKDGRMVSFTYFSSFSGCENKSEAVINFALESEMGLYSGNRNFLGNKDIYSFSVKENGRTFEAFGLSFANSTGNVEGDLSYRDRDENRQTVKVQCKIRNYEYGECR